METTNYYLELLDLDYDEIIEYMLEKYGPAKDDYYREKSYERFLNGEIKNITKGKYTRTSEGLYCHHIYENKYEKMADIDFIKWQKIPHEYQRKENLVYCNLVEHAIIHAIIAKETDSKFGVKGLRAYLLDDMRDWYIDGIKPILEWELNCYNRSFLDESDAWTVIDGINSYLE